MRILFKFKKQTAVFSFLIFLMVMHTIMIKSMRPEIEAFVLGRHPRVGEVSPVRKLSPYVLQEIAKYIPTKTVTIHYQAFPVGKKQAIPVSPYWTVRDLKEEFVSQYNENPPVPGSQIRPEHVRFLFRDEVMPDGKMLYFWATNEEPWPFTGKGIPGSIYVFIRGYVVPE